MKNKYRIEEFLWQMIFIAILLGLFVGVLWARPLLGVAVYMSLMALSFTVSAVMTAVEGRPRKKKGGNG